MSLYPPVQPPGCNNYTGRHPEGGRPTSVETARGLAQKHRLRPHIFLPTAPSPPGSSYLKLHKHATPTLLSRHRPHSRAPDFKFTHKNPITTLAFLPAQCPTLDLHSSRLTLSLSTPSPAQAVRQEQEQDMPLASLSMPTLHTLSLHPQAQRHAPTCLSLRHPLRHPHSRPASLRRPHGQYSRLSRVILPRRRGGSV